MSNDNKRKIEPWRIIIFSISLAVIVFLWVRRDIAEIYTSMPAEQIAPLIATTIAVSFLKVALIAGVVILIKWVIGKIKK